MKLSAYSKPALVGAASLVFSRLTSVTINKYLTLMVFCAFSFSANSATVFLSVDDGLLTTLSDGRKSLEWSDFDIEDISFTGGVEQEFSIQVIFDRQVLISDTAASSGNMGVNMTVSADGSVGIGSGSQRELLFANSASFNRTIGSPSGQQNATGQEGGSSVRMGLSSTNRSSWNLATIDVTDTTFRNTTTLGNSVNLTSAQSLSIQADEIFIAAVPIPATAWLFGTGLAGLFGVGRMKKKAA